MHVELRDYHVAEDSLWWDTDSPSADDAPVFENRWYILVLHGAKPNAECTLYVGDEPQKLETSVFSETLEFARGMYFESAYGPTELTVRTQTDGTERVLFRQSLYVVPSKIGDANYKRMVADLQSVCRALVFDIQGKSSVSAAAPRPTTTRQWRTLDEEQAAVCKAWNRLRPLLAEIKRAPKSVMHLRRQSVACARCRSPRDLVAMMKCGLDPTAETARRTFRAGRLVESRDCAEHRLIKAFLHLLCIRLADCRRGLAESIRRLEAEKKYRMRTSQANEASLYETEDRPRINRMRERDAEAGDVLRSLLKELSGAFWLNVSEAVFSPENSQFAENDYYLAAANIILFYLRDLSHWSGAFDSHFRAKKSSRLYEQWVLIQLVAAFRAAGLDLTEWDDILSRSLDTHYGFDFAHDTILRAPLGKGYELTIRYEPWIHPQKTAWRTPSETLCHHSTGNWCPDIVLSLVRTDKEDTPVYAIALDAKYSLKPTKEMLDSVRKYAQIHSTIGPFGRRVVRQVWLVYPGEEGRKHPFKPEDVTLAFSADKGLVYQDTGEAVHALEQTFADLIVAPAARAKATAKPSAAPAALAPQPAFAVFAQGTLAYFRRLVAAQGRQPNR